MNMNNTDRTNAHLAERVRQQRAHAIFTAEFKRLKESGDYPHVAEMPFLTWAQHVTDGISVWQKQYPRWPLMHQAIREVCNRVGDASRAFLGNAIPARVVPCALQYDQLELRRLHLELIVLRSAEYYGMTTEFVRGSGAWVDLFMLPRLLSEYEMPL